MSEEIKSLKAKADQAKYLYATKQISREKAAEEIGPYIEAFNKRSTELAKKFKQKAKTINFAGFIR